MNQNMQAASVQSELRGWLKSNTVIFDTRSTFDFNLHRVAGSINLPPRDFKVAADPLSASRRLSLWGVIPETPTLVVGSDLDSVTSLAWELAQAGIVNIETYSLEKLRTLNVFPEPSRQNSVLWVPNKNYQVFSRAEFDKLSQEELSKWGLTRVLQVGEASIPQNLKKTPISKWEDNFKFNSSFLLVSQQKFEFQIRSNDSFVLIDSSSLASRRAYVVAKSGIRKLILVK
ncbi:MAG: hypothetical protein ACK5W9_02040 [Bdellovibrionales bacterium]